MNFFFFCVAIIAVMASLCSAQISYNGHIWSESVRNPCSRSAPCDMQREFRRAQLNLEEGLQRALFPLLSVYSVSKPVIDRALKGGDRGQNPVYIPKGEKPTRETVCRRWKEHYKSIPTPYGASAMSSMCYNDVGVSTCLDHFAF